MADGGRPVVVLEGLRKSYGTMVALVCIDLSIRAGEFFTLPRPVGLRQDHNAAADRWFRTAG